MELAGLRRDGYALVPGVIEPAAVARLLEALRDVEGLDLADPASWGGARASVPMGGCQAQWDVRQDPALHAAFAAAYGDERLAVSQDRLGIKLPGAGALEIHLDVEPEAGPSVFGGLVYLTDAPPERGAFCVERDGRIVPVPGRAGDLVLWDVRVPHGNLANSDRLPRVVQYVSMFPHGAWGDAPADHQRLWREGRDWQDDHGPPAHRPAELTPLGRRLVGIEPYG